MKGQGRDVPPLMVNTFTISVMEKTETGVNAACRPALVAQWVRIRLPGRGTRGRSLVWGDSTCCRQPRPPRLSCWSPSARLRDCRASPPLLKPSPSTGDGLHPSRPKLNS